ncbi:MAG: hypothetical protein FWD01_01725, partial [Defluviitaleaceae bacterium]|nr:hypothetical protein [Defluviitaleaceae bacterium]
MLETINFNNLIKLSISNPIAKEKHHKIVIVRHNGFFQANCFHGKQVYHQNFSTAEELLQELMNMFTRYKQFDFKMLEEDIIMLTSKSGRTTTKRKPVAPTEIRKPRAEQGHNREKNHIISEN